MSAEPDTAFFRACHERVSRITPLVKEGRVRSVVGKVVEGEGLALQVGSVCEIGSEAHGDPIHAEVIGFQEDRFLMLPLADASGLAPGAPIRESGAGQGVAAATSCLGRVLDGLCRPIDGGPPLARGGLHPLHRRAEAPLARQRIDQPIDLGVRSINALLTAARGARIGLFAGSGVGKSTLLGQIAGGTRADVNVVALIGERGREVREFVEEELGPEVLARSIVLVATSDEPALLRRRTALVATAMAEQLRAQGLDVLLLMDSVTRFCNAQREIGLAAGEPPATRGYPPSLWSTLPELLERAGMGAGAGSITGIYTVLVEGDDMNEPVADALRALLDGHIVLSREIASRGQYPAIDVLASVSRLMPQVADDEHLASARRARQLLASYRSAEDLISIGAYVPGSDAAVDEARALDGPLRAFLQQPPNEHVSFADSVSALRNLLARPPADGATP